MGLVSKEQIDQVAERIVKAFNPQKVILFGSYAYGTPNESSDVDFMIIMESNERPVQRAARVSRLLRPRPFPMDILVRTPMEIQSRLDLGDPFIHKIFDQGTILYERRIFA